ncbi:MAG: tetratricopeptide repeat protein [bacterium]|nr:tetratricopeptide repeat protein [bacterium]
MRLLFFLLVIAVAFAELPSREVNKGNKAAQSGQTDQAQYHYVKALENHADTSTVMYNLGNAMYDAGEFERAMKIYSGAIDSTRTPEQLERAYYNMGNASFQAQKFDEAIASYIEALRNDPNDDDAKQNLELALRMKKKSEEQQQQQTQDQNKQDQQDKQDKQQDPQNQDQQKQDEQQEQQKDQQQQQQGDSSQTQQGQQQQPQQMSKEEAEQLLNALLQDEQNTLEQVRKAKVAQRKKRAKDW